MCHKLAVEANVKHGRLPLDKFLQMKARKVLTIDHGKHCELLNFSKIIILLLSLIFDYFHNEQIRSEIKCALIFLDE